MKRQDTYVPPTAIDIANMESAQEANHLKRQENKTFKITQTISAVAAIIAAVAAIISVWAMLSNSAKISSFELFIENTPMINSQK